MKKRSGKIFGIGAAVLMILVVIGSPVTSRLDQLDSGENELTENVNIRNPIDFPFIIEQLIYGSIYMPLGGESDDPSAFEELFDALVGSSGQPGGIFMLYDYDADYGPLYDELVYGTEESDEEDLLFFSIVVEKVDITNQYEVQEIIDEMEDPEEQAEAQSNYDALIAAGQVPEMEIVLYSTTDSIDQSYVQFLGMGFGLLSDCDGCDTTTRFSVPYIAFVGDEAAEFYDIFTTLIPEELIEVLPKEIVEIQAIEYELRPLGAQVQQAECPNPEKQQCIDDCHSYWDPILEDARQDWLDAKTDEERARSNLVSALKSLKSFLVGLGLGAVAGFAACIVACATVVGCLACIAGAGAGGAYADAELEAKIQAVKGARWAWEDAKDALETARQAYEDAQLGLDDCLYDCSLLPDTVPCPPAGIEDHTVY